MSTVEIIQTVIILALVLITAYYAWQTRRQANLNDLISWIDDLYKDISDVDDWRKLKGIEDAEESFVSLINQRLVLVRGCNKIDQELGVEISKTTDEIMRLSKHLKRYYEGNGKIEEVHAETVAIRDTLWKHLANIIDRVSELKAR